MVRLRVYSASFRADTHNSMSPVNHAILSSMLQEPVGQANQQLLSALCICYKSSAATEQLNQQNWRRYEKKRRQREQEALEACTFAPEVNRSSPRPAAATPPGPLRPTSRPATPGRVGIGDTSVSMCRLAKQQEHGEESATSRSEGSSKTLILLWVQVKKPQVTGGAAEALDFRVFMQQQAALEAAAGILSRPHGASPAAAAQLAPVPQPLAADDAPQMASAGDAADAKASDSLTGGGNVFSAAADATAASAAAVAPAAQEEVFSRLYEAAQASLRRKEAYGKAAAAAQLAALQSASPHALPLPAGFPKAAGSQAGSAAGAFNGLCFFHESA